jgi:hypothetical protein
MGEEEEGGLWAPTAVSVTASAAVAHSGGQATAASTEREQLRRELEAVRSQRAIEQRQTRAQLAGLLGEAAATPT